MKNVFFISSTQEAVALRILSRSREVHTVVYVHTLTYENVDQSLEYDIITEGIKAKQVAKISRHLCAANFPEASLAELLRQNKFNYLEISKLNANYFAGLLFEGSYHLYFNHHLSLDTLYDLKSSPYSLIAHSPAETISSLLRNKRKAALPSFFGLLKRYFHALFHISARLKILLFKLLVERKNFRCDACYSWVPATGCQLLSYSAVSDDFKFAINEAALAQFPSKRTLLLIDHPSQYKKIPSFYASMRRIDFVLNYSLILERYACLDELIICKFHPSISSFMDKHQFKTYKDQLLAGFMERGFHHVIFFEDIVLPGFSSLPVELFVDNLSLDKTIGTWSSTLLLEGLRDGKTIISDCTDLPCFASLRRMQLEVFQPIPTSLVVR